MKIENGNDLSSPASSADRQSTIQRIQEYQEQQVQLQIEQQALEQRQADEALRAQAASDAPADLERDPGLEAQTDLDPAADAVAADIQAQVQAQAVVEVNAAREQSGMEKADEAVEIANVQQDRGERWQSFAAREEAALPPSVEELAAQQQADAQADAQAEAQRKLNVQDLLNQMTIQGGRIPG